jgi:hypothetical protein
MLSLRKGNISSALCSNIVGFLTAGDFKIPYNLKPYLSHITVCELQQQLTRMNV